MVVAEEGGAKFSYIFKLVGWWRVMVKYILVVISQDGLEILLLVLGLTGEPELEIWFVCVHNYVCVCVCLCVCVRVCAQVYVCACV